MLATAYAFADDSIAERPAICETGNFTVEFASHHKVCACVLVGLCYYFDRFVIVLVFLWIVCSFFLCA